jgi:hypothetical protein
MTKVARAIGAVRRTAAAAMSIRARLRVGPGHAAALIACSAVLACGAALAQEMPEAKHPVQAPHYGDTLFHFYQEQYFTAVTGLMVSQHFGRVSPHDDEAEVLRGGLLLSYGLHREAGLIFAQLIERGAPSSVRDRAWYFLAKIRYQRGESAGALDALARVGGRLPAALEEDRGLLHANLLMARKDFAAAADVLRGMSAAKSDASHFVRYNLGVAMVKSGDVAGGSGLLDEVGRMPSASEEQRALRDKANVALGFAALQDGRADDARQVLQRVRMQGLQANKALLGFGWAEASLKQPAKALVPWIELAGRSQSDAAVLEAKIAVPYAYAELGAFGQAHDGYEQALAQFDREHVSLDESIAAIRSGRLLDGLDRANPGEEMGWFWSLRTLPEMPHAEHLSHVLAQHDFQEAFKNYRDLRYLDRNLKQWKEALGAFNDMLAARRQAYADRLPQARAGAGSADAVLAELKQRRAQLGAALDRAQAGGDVAAFADAKESTLLHRVADVQAMMRAAGQDPDVSKLADKARLVSGVLAWQLAQEYANRLWDAKKAMQAADEQLAQAVTREAGIAQAQREEPARFDRFAKRIAELEARLQALVPRVAALSGEQREAVQALAVEELVGQQQRLAEYGTQARFAVAQLVDRAQLAATQPRGGGDASTR